MTPFNPGRRRVLASGIALAVTGLAAKLVDTQALAATPAIHVFKDPNCGCCRAWIDHLRNNGFTVSAEDRVDMAAIKTRLGVPSGMRSCHTATVANYVIEGHVPAADIHRLLDERPEALGLAVPGMPIGSPGMEMGSRRQAFKTWLMTADDAQMFSAHPAAG